MRRWLCFLFLFTPSLLLAKQLMLTIPTTYPLNVVNTQLICSSLHANLSTEALNKLDTLSNVPFTCKQAPNDPKQLIIIFNLQG